MNITIEISGNNIEATFTETPKPVEKPAEMSQDQWLNYQAEEYDTMLFA